MQGNIGVTTENIFPVIKKFLYSDHDIFIREIISNATDATNKYKAIIYDPDAVETEELKITVTIDKEQKTITVSDNGIGMTGEEIEKYINQIAFSGATDFLEKYKDTNIIGHFGLGFYSSFMVSDKVEIITKSYLENSVPQHWVCDGSPSYTLEECEKETRGTDIIMHIGEEFEEYLELSKILELLNTFNKFNSVNIDIVEGENTTPVKVLNPLWAEKPTDLTDEDYLKLYRSLYPGKNDPLFWIHLNVDFPFNLSGILYFPEIKSNPILEKKYVSLYCNQVYVTDNVSGILPEFLSLLHGVIDSPDIPLNVSRSYLQSDANVKKISGYISNKVQSTLSKMIKDNREDYETKWPSIEMFIQVGLITDETLYEKFNNVTLFKDVNDKYFTIDEYIESIKETQTDKDNRTVVLYTTDVNKQYSYCSQAKECGYNVLNMSGPFVPYVVNMFENKLENVKFIRVDADTIDKLIDKGEDEETTLDENDKMLLIDLFSSQLKNTFEGVQMSVKLAYNKLESLPITVTVDEFSRRMKEASIQNPTMSWFRNQKTKVFVTINTKSSLIQTILEKAKNRIGEKYLGFVNKVKDNNEQINMIKQTNEGKPEEEVSQTDKDAIEAFTKDIVNTNMELTNTVQTYTNKNNKIKQLLDIAYLQNGLLEGEAFVEFLKRSVKVLE